MRKRPSGYMIFLIVMAALTIVGAVLLIAGGVKYHELPRPWPGAGLLAQWFPL